MKIKISILILLTNSGFLKFPFILEKKIIFFKVNLHKHYLSFEICFWVASLLEGLVCSQQRPKGAAKPLTFFQFLFLLFAALRWGIRLALARWGRGRQLDALLKISHKSFSPTSWPVFSPTFSAPFSTSFSAAFVASFFAVFPVNFATIFPNTSPNPAPIIPLCQDLFLFFQFPFLVFITTVREMSMSFKFTSRSSSSVNQKVTSVIVFVLILLHK